MLETVRALLDTEVNMSFEEYFNEYIMAVQDVNISAEVKYTMNQLKGYSIEVEQLVQQDHERAVNMI